MLVELSPFDRRAVRFDDPVNIIRLTEKLARYMVAESRDRAARDWGRPPCSAKTTCHIIGYGSTS
jgi:hypothetical protein